MVSGSTRNLGNTVACLCAYSTRLREFTNPVGEISSCIVRGSRFMLAGSSPLSRIPSHIRRSVCSSVWPWAHACVAAVRQPNMTNAASPETRKPSMMQTMIPRSHQATQWMLCLRHLVSLQTFITLIRAPVIAAVIRLVLRDRLILPAVAPPGRDVHPAQRDCHTQSEQCRCQMRFPGDLARDR